MKYLLSIIAIFLIFSSKAQTIFTLEHNGATSVYKNFDTTLYYAQGGDIIYLPGGVFSFPTMISKSVNLVGAGFFADSTTATGQTIVTTDVQLNAVSNFSMTGIFFQGNFTITNSSNILISRCRMGSTNTKYINTNANVQSLLVTGCVLNTMMINGSAQSITLKNSIIYGPITGNALSISNSIIFQPADASGRLFLYSSTLSLLNSVLENNIIYSPYYGNPATSFTFNSFHNNIFCNINSLGGNISQNNILNYSFNNVLNASISYQNYNATNDFHPINGSPAFGAGLNGVDCGIYGGSTPFKEGALPFNPHIKGANIPSVTNANGNLDVSFQVNAQDN